ncbi:hypothetical protein [Nocardiopsis lambiniae]|uniref:Uncharacterized protein n=1 Tax=Nocardiopsis lambiniae TaxID=3075539 RepID=A0ABU2MFP6_9ACTN|nr:hypothetical protein [Nocardiopsis sp. DSM 44743]MDT0331516.1 hypothetical protein [Nocardiopsis sp. DSM 44743]
MYARPPLRVLFEGLSAIERREDVAWVRVRPHPEPLECGDLARAAGEATSAPSASCARVREGEVT